MMPDDKLPLQLIVSAPVGGKQEQKRHWNDVSKDLKQCNLSGTWRQQALEHGSWLSCSVALLNKQDEE